MSVCILTAQARRKRVSRNWASSTFPVNFNTKWLLCNVHVHFDCAGSQSVLPGLGIVFLLNISIFLLLLLLNIHIHIHIHIHHIIIIITTIIIIIILILIIITTIIILIKIIININTIINIVIHYPFIPPHCLRSLAGIIKNGSQKESTGSSSSPAR